MMARLALGRPYLTALLHPGLWIAESRQKERKSTPGEGQGQGLLTRLEEPLILAPPLLTHPRPLSLSPSHPFYPLYVNTTLLVP